MENTLKELQEGFALLSLFSNGQGVDINAPKTVYKSAAPLFGDTSQRCSSISYLVYRKVLMMLSRKIQHYLHGNNRTNKDAETDYFELDFTTGGVSYIPLNDENYVEKEDIDEIWNETFCYELDEDREFYDSFSPYSNYLRLYESKYSSLASIRITSLQDMAEMMGYPTMDKESYDITISDIPKEIRAAISIEPRIAGKWARTGKLSPSELFLHGGFDEDSLISYGLTDNHEGKKSLFELLRKGLPMLYEHYDWWADCEDNIKKIFFENFLKLEFYDDSSHELLYDKSIKVFASPLLYVYRSFRRSALGKACRRHDRELFEEVDRAYSFFLRPTCIPHPLFNKFGNMCEGGYLGKLLFFGSNGTTTGYSSYGNIAFTSASITRGFPLAHKMMDMGILYLNSRYHFLGDIPQKKMHNSESEGSSDKTTNAA